MNRSAQLMFFPYFCLIGHSRRRALSRLPLSGQLLSGAKRWLPAVGAAAPVGGAVGARRVPGHADQERAVMPVVRRPPRLAVGHQRRQVALQSLVVELVERLGIVEVVAHRVGRHAALVEDVERERDSGHQSRFCRPSSERTRGRRGPPGSPSIRRSSRPSSCLSHVRNTRCRLGSPLSGGNDESLSVSTGKSISRVQLSPCA